MPSKKPDSAKILLCVDRYECIELAGRLYNTYLPCAQDFCSLNEMVLLIEALLDKLQFPKPQFSPRSFFGRARAKKSAVPNRTKELSKKMNDEIFSTEQGEKATFIVQVHYRQNATWQGAVRWVEQKKTRHFRSALELLTLMNGALAAPPQEGDLPADWEEENEEI